MDQTVRSTWTAFVERLRKDVQQAFAEHPPQAFPGPVHAVRDEGPKLRLHEELTPRTSMASSSLDPNRKTSPGEELSESEQRAWRAAIESIGN